jgi:hypothetical protein
MLFFKLIFMLLNLVKSRDAVLVDQLYCHEIKVIPATETV